MMASSINKLAKNTVSRAHSVRSADRHRNGITAALHASIRIMLENYTAGGPIR